MDAVQHEYASSAILVIEDNPAQLKTLTDILKSEALQPIGCVSGQDALNACQHHDVHVALLDLRLSDMDGLDVLRQLKHLRPDIKVIIHTAYATLESAMEAVNREAFAYVQKMSNVNELLAHVHRAFHTHLTGYSEQLEWEVHKRTADLVMANEALRKEIAERMQIEEDLRQLTEELEFRVRQRTADFASVNKALQEFTYITSHDLKTPLRGIRQIAKWLVEDYNKAFDEKGKEMLDLLISRVRRMDKLIDGLLRYSRLGQILGEEEELDLNKVLAEVVRMLAPPPQIHVRVDGIFPAIVGDRVRIEQIFLNLIGNAITFMDKPQGIILVGCEDAGEFWKFRIEDNGPGIEERHYERIFQIFQTLKSPDASDHAGVGLTITKKIVELHGGQIWLESKIGVGSIFYFTLPKVQPQGDVNG